MIKGDLNITLV